jgi:hypothetical protein
MKWNIFTTLINSFEWLLVLFVSSFGFMGLTLGLTLLQEVIWIISFHLYLMYRVIALMFNQTLRLNSFLYFVIKDKNDSN